MGGYFMREGFYKVEYEGMLGYGVGVLVLDTNMVIGADSAGGTYDGRYEWNVQKEQFETNITVYVPEGVQTVQGQIAPSGGMKFEVRCNFPREPENIVVMADTDYGPVAVRLQQLRTFS